MNRKEDSVRPRSVTKEESTDLSKELICSQQEAPHTQLKPRKITTCSSIRTIIKKETFVNPKG